MSRDGGLAELLRSHITGAHWQRIETGAVGSGVPDINFCIDSVEGWIETKLTDTFKVNLDPLQVGWISRRWRAGGRVMILTRRRHAGGPRKGPPVDELWVHWGEHAAALLHGGLQQATPLLFEEGGPRKWNWDRVKTALTAARS